MGWDQDVQMIKRNRTETEKRRRAGWKTTYESYSMTIRQLPENYCLAIERSDGTFYAAPDNASSIGAHSLSLVLAQAEGRKGYALADFVHESFWGNHPHMEGKS